MATEAPPEHSECKQYAPGSVLWHIGATSLLNISLTVEYARGLVPWALWPVFCFCQAADYVVFFVV